MKRNCLFILVDCLRADKLWNTGRSARTPNIDRLCNKGTVFTQSIATTTTTTPSVASLLTGLYPFSHGIRSLRGYKLKSGVTTLAEVFKENGYHTYAEVTGPLMPVIGLDRGFENYHFREKSMTVYSAWFDKLLSRFRNRDFKEPYFLFIHFFELHLPRSMSTEYDKRYFGKTRYERSLSGLDNHLGELLSWVNDDTLIILHADHGEKISETIIDRMSPKLGGYLWRLNKIRAKTSHDLYRVGHGFHVYDYLVRVPLIFAGRDIIPQNKWISDQVRQVDIFPTIVETLDLKKRDLRIDGRSLLPFIKGQTLPELPAYCEACGTGLLDKTKWLAGLRTTKYKYVFSPYTSDSTDELYDLVKDPNEKRNIISKQPEIARELRLRLREIRKVEAIAAIKRRVDRIQKHGRI